MKANAILVRFETPDNVTVPVHYELRCLDCAEGYSVEGGPPVHVNQPNRKNYKTEKGYIKAMIGAYICADCGDELDLS